MLQKPYLIVIDTIPNYENTLYKDLCELFPLIRTHKTKRKYYDYKNESEIKDLINSTKHTILFNWLTKDYCINKANENECDIYDVSELKSKYTIIHINITFKTFENYIECCKDVDNVFDKQSFNTYNRLIKAVSNVSSNYQTLLYIDDESYNSDLLTCFNIIKTLLKAKKTAN